MSYVTQNTVWLADDQILPPAVRQILARFYELADDRSPDAGPRMAAEVFSTDAVLFGAGSDPQGTAGATAISKSRDHAWNVVDRRRHTIERVFGSADGREVMLIGSLDTTLKNGRSLVVPFTAHVNVVRQDGDTPRIQMMHVYADSAPLTTALKAA
ncbi:hypothetical protein SEUCBS139899_008000 [Sporothrix eucalyptigena]|uniref:SnoaL-like domain-containing protein n=1 Tax=Sporothrix eucalyptigena TaxID=1812306 RepID=A0ABP0BZP5_9PEZI